MTHAIRVLRQEHERFDELLNLFEHLLEHQSAGASPNFPLLRDIGDYLTGYPDKVHHPKEDLIYRRLHKRAPADKDGPGALVREHTELSDLALSYVRTVDEASRNPEAWSERLQRCMANLLDAYRHHMKMEEMYFFPQAIERLTADDWEELTFTITEEFDPLFDETATRFERLRNEILQHARHHAGRSLGSFASGFEAIESVEQFNEFCRKKNVEYRMEKQAEGKFTIRTGDANILTIPACGEKTAAWCAWCFIAGLEAKFS